MEFTDTQWAWPWWAVMVIINAINLIIAALIIKRTACSNDAVTAAYQKRMLIMGAVFVIVGAYRSVFVSRYLTQMAWFDNFANSALLIRMFAFCAELSFAGLFALALLQINKDLPPNNHNSGLIKFINTKSPYCLFICIFIAQFFATSGLIFKNSTLFSIEETLWTIGFMSIMPLAFMQLRRVLTIRDEIEKRKIKMLASFIKLTIAWGVIYCSYGLFYHLPFENWASAIDQIETGLPAIKSGFNAVTDAFTIVNETKQYGDWGFGFLLWHSCYFSVCVWIAIFLMRGPRKIESQSHGIT
ncbi:MAG: hypothetical protein ACI90U_001267 [Pseudomonadales bacterium]|jgi:hypothetical protein